MDLGGHHRADELGISRDRRRDGLLLWRSEPVEGALRLEGTTAGPEGARAQRVSDMGFPQIGYQAFKLLAYQRLHELARRWEDRYPGVDIILIEPEPNDELMFQTSIMNYTSRVDIARHGFQSVTLKLAHDYARFKEICARHGIEISGTRVRKVVKHFEAERESTRAWRKILEQTTSTLLRQSAEQ